MITDTYIAQLELQVKELREQKAELVEMLTECVDAMSANLKNAEKGDKWLCHVMQRGMRLLGRSESEEG